MSVFCFKKIDTAVRLGDQFRQRRSNLKLTLEDVVEKTRIPLKYLAALESGHFTELPKAKSHRLAYVKEYATLLKLSPAVCVSQFTCEDGLEDSIFIHPHKAVRLLPFASVSTALRATILLALVVSFASYLVWQVKRVLEPPQLAVYSPEEGHVMKEPKTTIAGETERETHLTVNGQEILVREDGSFETTIDLTAGLNTITIEATKKHGKTTIVTRHVVAKPASTVRVDNIP